MTLGVDRQTSSLLVSSSLEIFEDVKATVESLDTAAKTANRTIRLVQLRNADPLLIQRSLTSIFPRVSTSSVTTSRTTGTGGEGSSGQAGGASAAEDKQRAEAIRMWRERMMQMRGGGGRGNSEGRGGDSGRGRRGGDSGRGRRGGDSGRGSGR